MKYYYKQLNRIIEQESDKPNRELGKFATDIRWLLNKIIVVSNRQKKIYDKDKIEKIKKTDKNKIYGAIWHDLDLVTVAEWDGKDWHLL